MDELINRVDESGIITFNLEDYYPKGERVLIDLADHLFEQLIIKEKDFREFIKNENWQKYKGKFVAVTCSADAIIPVWAYMLVASALEPHASKVFMGTLEEMERQLFAEVLSGMDIEIFRGARVTIKGCGNRKIPDSAYMHAVSVLQPVVKSIMYGEPCSTVPIYKQKNQ